MGFTARLLEVLILTAGVLLWARWSKLDLGLRAPAMKGVWPWVLLFTLWCVLEQAITEVRPLQDDSSWVQELERVSPLQLIVLIVVFGPIFEELLFRGALFSVLMRRWGLRVAVVVPSILWGLTHVSYEIWHAASVAGSGVVLAIIRWKSDSLYVPLALHAAFNFVVALTYILAL